jgi:uncharacterized membrane protein HdeD (DUF308 family)
MQSSSLIYGTIGALAVCSGYASLSQAVSDASYAKQNVHVGAPTIVVGMLMFLLGLMLLGSVFVAGQDTSCRSVIVASLILIGIGALYDVYRFSKGRYKSQDWFKILEAAAVLVVGYCLTSNAGSSTAKLLGPFAAVLVIVATGYVLPKAREAGETDSSGYVLLTFGLLFSVYLNSARGVTTATPPWLKALHGQFDHLSHEIQSTVRKVLPTSASKIPFEVVDTPSPAPFA